MMRIIAGEHRGRKILSPEGQNTRPVTDRVKQAMFDRLWAADKVEGSIVLDLFSGTGSMGLECLSRGAEHVTFVERDRPALTLLKQNIETLRLGSRATVLSSDALSAALIPTLGVRTLDLAFVDPPYATTEDERDRARIMQQVERLAARANAGAWLLVRTASTVKLPGAAGWSGPAEWNYGSMTVHRYERE